MTIQAMSDTIMSNSDAAVTQGNVDKRATYLAQLFRVSEPVTFSASIQPHLAKDYSKNVVALQQQASARLPELAIPSTGDEDWRFTDLSSLLEVEFQSPTPCFPLPTSIELRPLLLPEVPNRLVFVNGTYEPDFSQLPDIPEGITVSNIKTINDGGFGTDGDERFLAHLAQQPDSEEVFTTLNTATFQDIAVIFLGKNQVLDVPIHLLFVSTVGQTPIFFQPRCLVVAEPHSSLNLIEDYVTLGHGCTYGLVDRTYFCNAVTEICLGENASLNHYRIQREGKSAFHIGKTAVTQARDSRYNNISVSLGARLSRHNLHVCHQGEQVETNLYGLALATDEQLTDTHSAIWYNYPYGRSDQLYKTIADGRGRSVFNGKVVVPQAAQLTDAKQLNRNLLLSPKARVDTKPQLEIVANNVKCTHGATVSQLEDDEIFYLQSRGLDRDNAQKLLIDGFAAEILQHVPINSLRDALAKAITYRTVIRSEQLV